MSHTDLGVDATCPIDWQFFLVGDIGGTNSRLEIIDAGSNLIKRLDVLTADYHSFTELLTHFLQGLKITPNNIFGAVAFASKILQNKTVTNANYKWEQTDGNAIREHFGFKEMVLLNDFEACGYAVPILDKSKIISLTSHEQPDFHSNLKIMLVGPGTGLGVCLLSQKYVLFNVGTSTPTFSVQKEVISDLAHLMNFNGSSNSSQSRNSVSLIKSSAQSG